MAESRVTDEGVPIEHLDYSYVKNCKNVKEVEKILKVLRSGSEGYYPDLIRFTEARLKELCPTSKLLIKSQPVKRMSDLPFEESRELNADLEQWASQMSSQESRHTNGPTAHTGLHEREVDGEEDSDRNLPPVRTPGSITKGQTKADQGATNNNVAAGKSERIPSYDFRAWDKFDAEKVAGKVDETEMKRGSTPIMSPKGIPLELSDIEKSMSSVDKENAALREKNKGNEAYRSGDYQEALVYYTRSIKFHPTAPAFNNRAITEIKLGQHQQAICDCDEVLRLESNNTKALFRRATAYTHVKEYRAAAEDMERVLQLEPNNKKVQEDLNRLRRDHLEPAAQQKQPKKGKRIEIEESDGEDEEDGGEGEKEPESVETAATVDQPEMRDSTESPASSTEEEEEVSGKEGSAVKYSSNGPILSPASEGREEKEALPMETKQTSVPNWEQKAPPPESVKDIAKLSQDVTPKSVAPPSQQQETVPPEGAKGIPTPPQEATSIPIQQSQVLETPPPLVQALPPPEPPPELPPSVKKLKEEGNDMFRRGQYVEAVERYTKGIAILEKASKVHIPNISTLLNNRAACHLKNGNSRGCINDCTKSIELVPVNLKALLRRAQAYEAMEKYKLAYNDFHLALRLDGSIEAAYTASSRIIKLLQDEDGHDWRDKLPPHPDAERVKAALSEHRFRSGSLGGLPLLSSIINVDQANGARGEGVQSSNGSIPDRHDSSTIGETSNVGGRSSPAVGGASVSESTESGKRERKKEDRREQTEERVPEIPPVNVTATSTSMPQVTQTTQSVPIPHHSDAPPTGPSLSQLSAEQKFEQLKAEGNDHVKKGEFVEALNCYSLCVNACPNRVVGYTNRALCHLKLKSPRSAEDDCSMALSLEPDNVKALYRRALARKALSKYMEATKDLKTLLELDPSNSVAQQEFAEVKQLWTKKLREIQLQKETAKGTQSSQKTKSGKSGGSSKKKSGQRKPPKDTVRTNAYAELQKRKEELEKLLQEAAKYTEEAKKQASPTSQTRKNELDQLLKETRAKKKAAETKAAEAKAAEARAAESRTAESRAAEDKGTESGAAVSDKPPTPTGTITKTTVVEENSSDVKAEETSESVDHLTASKTTYYKEKSKSKAEKGDKTTPPAKATDIPVSKESKPFPSDIAEKTAPAASKDKWKKIVVEEGPASDEDIEEADGETAPAATATTRQSSSTNSMQEQRVMEPESKPAAAQPAAKAKERLASPYEFVQRWNSIPRTGQSLEYARLLEQIAPETLPDVITNKLDGMMLTNIIRAISKQFIPKRQYKLTVDILLYLTKVPRFQMNAMFLGPIDKEDLKSIFAVLSTHKDQTSVPPGMLQTLKRSYGLES